MPNVPPTTGDTTVVTPRIPPLLHSVYSLHTSRDFIYEALEWINELRAQPPDRVIVRPRDPEYGLLVVRNFPVEVYRQIPDHALEWLEQYDAGPLFEIVWRFLSRVRLVRAERDDELFVRPADPRGPIQVVTAWPLDMLRAVWRKSALRPLAVRLPADSSPSAAVPAELAPPASVAPRSRDPLTLVG